MTMQQRNNNMAPSPSPTCCKYSRPLLPSCNYSVGQSTVEGVNLILKNLNRKLQLHLLYLWICLFYSGFTSLWKIFRSHCNCMWQGAHCSLLATSLSGCSTNWATVQVVLVDPSKTADLTEQPESLNNSLEG